MKNIKAILLITLLLSNMVYAETKYHIIKDNKFLAPKNIILSSLKSYPLERKALILAIASIETEYFDVDYPVGDRKIGDAFNVGIYKVNRYLIKLVNQKAGTNFTDSMMNRDKLHATKFVNTGMNVLGENLFLRINRGGQSFLKYNTDNYIIAVRGIQRKYLQNPKKYMYGPYRITTYLKAI